MRCFRTSLSRSPALTISRANFKASGSVSRSPHSSSVKDITKAKGVGWHWRGKSKVKGSKHAIIASTRTKEPVIGKGSSIHL